MPKTWTPTTGFNGQCTISPRTARDRTWHTYLHPKLLDGNHPNLNVLVESQVLRILFEDKKATGVEYIPNSDLQANPADSQRPVRRVRARKLVIASGGTFGTPALLERSGIGNREILNRVGVSDIISHVPGVGEAFTDHPLMLYAYRSSLAPEDTFDALATGRVDPGELIKNNAKILGWNAMDIACKIRPNEADVAALGPDFQEAWDCDFKNNPNKPLVLMSLINR